MVSDSSGYVFLYHPTGHNPYRKLVVSDAYWIAFNSNKTLLYVTQSSLGAISVYQYPSLKLYGRSISLPHRPKDPVPLLFGAAVWPPPANGPLFKWRYD